MKILRKDKRKRVRVRKIKSNNTKAEIERNSFIDTTECE